MAITFYREAISGSDPGVWANYELPQNRAGAIGQYTSYLYNDSGTLKASKGFIGIDNSAHKGVNIIDAATTIDVSGVTDQTWAKIEISVTLGVGTITATDISGATDPENLPSEFTSAYNQDKQGFYIDSTKRVIGLIWLDSVSALSGIINVKPFINGYIGTIDDGDDNYYFESELGLRKDYQLGLPIGSIIAWHKTLTGCPNLPSNFVECNGQTLSDAQSPFNGQTIPDLNGDNRFLRGNSTSGDLQDDAFQGHEMNLTDAGGNIMEARAINSGAAFTGVYVASGGSDARIKNFITDGVNGTPRVDSETRPINMSVVWIIKIK